MNILLGLPNNPFNGSVDIIMRNSGPITLQLPTNFPLSAEQKMIAVMGGLDLHGLPRGLSWTRLSSTATSGQNIIRLSQPVNWIVGEEILITTTDKDISHTERHRIANIVNRTIITTVTPLSFTHLVIQQTFPNGQTVRISAAVGLLTHNVRVIGQTSGSGSLSGFRMVLMSYETDMWHAQSSLYHSACYRGYARITNTQLIGFGQFDDSYNMEQRAGIYFNNLGDYNSNRQTYVDSSSFDGGFNAA